MDLEIYEFKEDLVNRINNSKLPWSVKQMCLQDILGQMNIATATSIESQRAAREAQKAGEQQNG